MLIQQQKIILSKPIRQDLKVNNGVRTLLERNSRRIDFERWQRNLAVGLGNAPYQQGIIEALQEKQSAVSELVQEHITWAIEQQQEKLDKSNKKTARLIRAVEKGLVRDA